MSSLPRFDVCLRGGLILDGTGSAPYRGDIGIIADRIIYVGPHAPDDAALEVSAEGLAVAPGFINLLSWANESLIVDSLAQSDLRQGITLEVMGEGWSMGPHTATTRQRAEAAQGDICYPITWSTLGGYFDMLEQKGTAVNVASYVGAISIRQCVLGDENVQPTPEQMQAMCDLADEAMREGALGVASAIPYVPGCFASKEELHGLAAVAARYGGTYATHIRSESHTVLEALDEAIDVARNERMRVHVYHLKSAGAAHAAKFEQMLEKIEQARAVGLEVSADAYCYTSAWAALSIGLPPWAQAGGLDAFIARMSDSETRQRVAAEIASDQDEWESYYQLAGPEGTLLLGFVREELKPLTGRTLAHVAAERNQPPEQTLIDLVVKDRSPVLAAFFLTAEDQVRRKMSVPWISFGSDAAAPSVEGVHLASQPHPRSYGNMARLLGHYVREEKLLTLEQAVHRLTGFAASILGVRDRGRLAPGCYADVVLFDAEEIRDHATYQQPHQYATGVQQVWVNGVCALKDGEPTGALPGRIVRGAGYQPVVGNTR